MSTRQQTRWYGGLRVAQMLCVVIFIAAAGAASATARVDDIGCARRAAGRALQQTASPPRSPSPSTPVVAASTNGSVYTRACWQKTFSRGVGTVPDACQPGLQAAGAFCYPPCKAGYTAFVASCFSVCPAGYRDDGALCTRDPHIFGKGCCCTIFGCCNNCPAGYNDDGCTCHRRMHTIAKSSYTRPTYNKVCGAGLENSGGLCYKPCPSGMYGSGMFCYASRAPTGYPIRCGITGGAWAKDNEACHELMENESALAAKAGIAAGTCFATILAAVLTGGLLAEIPARICPQSALNFAAGASENIANLAAFPECP